jgi:hypothetical protein
MSFKSNADCNEDAERESNMGETFTDWVEITCVNTENKQWTENDVGDDEEKVSHTETGKKVVENTLHRFLTQDYQAE